MANKIKPKVRPEKGNVYIKGAKKTDAEWFKGQARKLGYTQKEFFEVLVEQHRR